jgi:ABC-2 type transport system permease protein
MRFSDLVRSELVKLRTTRTFLGNFIAAVGIVAIICVAVALATSSVEDVSADGVTIASIAVYFAFVIGVLSVSSEFRHGTITPSLLVVPDRERLLTAKFVSHLLAGLVIGAAAVVTTYVLLGGLVELRGIDNGIFSADALKYVAGILVASALFTALGVGLGAIMRNQVGAIFVGLGFLFMVEPLLTIIPTFGEWVADYGLGASSDALMGSAFGAGDPALNQVEGGLVFLGYVVIVAVFGYAIFRRRDVTA